MVDTAHEPEPASHPRRRWHSDRPRPPSARPPPHRTRRCPRTFAEANRDTTPNLAGNTVYLATRDNRFVALDVATGRERWRTAPVVGILTQTSAFANGLLVATTRSGVIVAFGEGGAIAWQRQSVGDPASPVVANGVVYVAGPSNLIALDAATGKEAWDLSYNYYDPDFPLPYRMTNYPPAIGDGRLYLPGVEGTLYARDLADGDLTWHFATGGLLTALPTLANGVVYLAGNDHVLYAIDAATGKERWRMTLDERSTPDRRSPAASPTSAPAPARSTRSAARRTWRPRRHDRAVRPRSRGGHPPSTPPRIRRPSPAVSPTSTTRVATSSHSTWRRARCAGDTVMGPGSART
jgi:hypothetical protein